mmetsp:Transcript_4478/g.6050  ORF Transcript_4478/g.6050 Transcript_4478/m.6050 type:complete len:445 (+) Transcript_4478:261-1595(+)
MEGGAAVAVDYIPAILREDAENNSERSSSGPSSTDMELVMRLCTEERTAEYLEGDFDSDDVGNVRSQTPRFASNSIEIQQRRTPVEEEDAQSERPFRLSTDRSVAESTSEHSRGPFVDADSDFGSASEVDPVAILEEATTAEEESRGPHFLHSNSHELSQGHYLDALANFDRATDLHHETEMDLDSQTFSNQLLDYFSDTSRSRRLGGSHHASSEDSDEDALDVYEFSYFQSGARHLESSSPEHENRRRSSQHVRSSSLPRFVYADGEAGSGAEFGVGSSSNITLPVPPPRENIFSNISKDCAQTPKLQAQHKQISNVSTHSNQEGFEVPANLSGLSIDQLEVLSRKLEESQSAVRTQLLRKLVKMETEQLRKQMEDKENELNSEKMKTALLVDGRICPVCISNAHNMAFQCGHQVCQSCGMNPELQDKCPICREPITARIILF